MSHSPPTAPGLREEVAGQLAACFDVMATLETVGDKWSMILILLLGNGSRRFGELKQLIPGISQRMLTLTLRGLERDGLVQRTAHATVPPRVDYALTPLGRSMSEPMVALGKWAQAHEAEIKAARREFDAES